MRRFFVIIMVLLPLLCFAQEFYNIKLSTNDINLSATLLKNYNGLKKGEKVFISQLEHYIKVNRNDVDNYKNGYCLVIDNKTIPVDDNLGEVFDFKYSSIDDFWKYKVLCDVLENLRKNGPQIDLRKEIEQDVLEYVNKVNVYNMDFKDPFLENYIYGLIAKITPATIIDGRPGNIKLLILDDPSLNACMYPNGLLVINTGLLSVLHSEDELVAILAHEIGHYILDHSIININKEIKRQTRAEFWTAMATGVTAVAESIATAKNDYYVPGAATLGVAILSSFIAESVVNRLGMEYNHEQEMEADKTAIKVLKILGYDKNALSTAFRHMSDALVKERNTSIYFKSYTHPSLIERIQLCGTPNLKNAIDNEFEKINSLAISSVSRMKYELGRFNECIYLAYQNINNDVATSQDYLLVAKSYMALYNTLEKNQEALNMILKAKSIDPNDINLYKAEIVARLRMKQKNIAIDLLNSYLEKLNNAISTVDNGRCNNLSEPAFDYFYKEIVWSKNMIVKLNVISF